MFVIRKMLKNEINTIAVEWAAKEGWNPGLYDVDAFYAADPNGFLVGELDGEPIACISVVAYEEDFSFLGFYIVKPEHRGKGYGMRIWNEGIKYLSGKNIGLDGVVDQQENYKKSGLKYEYGNIRCQMKAFPAAISGLTEISEIHFDKLTSYDRNFFPSVRGKFLDQWIKQPEGKGYTILNDGNLDGYGVIRKCRSGYKIGPLFAESFEAAEKLFLGLQNFAFGDTVYLDIPEVNPHAVKLTEKHKMIKVFQTARMYTKSAPSLPLNKIFGVTTFELG